MLRSSSSLASKASRLFSLSKVSSAVSSARNFGAACCGGNHQHKHCAQCRHPNCTPGPHCELPWTEPARSFSAPDAALKSESEIQDMAKYVMHTYNRPNFVLSHGKGPEVWDTNGNRYLDFTSGIAVNALGHGDEAWAKVIAEQASKLVHISNLYHNGPALNLARRLVENSNFDRVFFCNSGTEANEGALKFAKKIARDKHGAEKTQMVSFSHGFHGRSMGALSVTAKLAYREPFGKLVPDVDIVEFNDLEAAAKVISKEKTAAVIVEPLQGEGGVLPASGAFLRGLRQLCTAADATLIVDEVQCGLGRTGRLWAHEAYGIKPDIMTLAKPLAGGLPIGAIMVTEQVASHLKPGDHGTTFGGGPLACAAANETFDRIADPEFLKRVRTAGNRIIDRIIDMHPRLPKGAIVDVRSAGGLLIGLEFSKPVGPLVAYALEKGLLLVNAGEKVLRIAPPLVVTDAQIDEAFAIIEAGVAKL